jgi:histidinol phosphatase-like enzyme
VKICEICVRLNHNKWENYFFIDRDGTMVLEPEGYQLDSLDKLEFYPKAFQYLKNC